MLPRMSNRRRLLLLPIFVLIAAAINMPFAVWCAKPPPPGVRGRTTFNLIGPEANHTPWPARTPHAQPWPPINQHQIDRIKFGAVRTTCWGSTNPEPRNTTHQIQVERYGWPIASMERVVYFWPWDDPAWSLNARQDTGMRIRWSGTLLNPLVAGSALWLLVVGLPWLVLARRARRRLRRGLCPACAYPYSNPDRCTECGLARPRSANPAAYA